MQLASADHCLACAQGRLTLLLGPPGSGKSTLLKALSGKLDRGLHMDGDITYNGHRYALHSFEAVTELRTCENPVMW
jgi:ABC-type multidrug transport system ATPase subunit